MPAWSDAAGQDESHHAEPRFARELGSLEAIADLYAKAKLEPKPLFDSRASQPGLCSG
jgi:hypothetical protein